MSIENNAIGEGGSDAQALPLSTALRERIPTMLRAKVLAGAWITLWVAGGYTALQRVHLFPKTEMPVTAIDRAIPFNDHHVWMYMSMYVFLPWIVLCIGTRWELRRYWVGTSIIALLSHLAFLFFPTTITRPADAHAEHMDPFYRLIVQMDATSNACPSLHASQTVYAAILATVMLSGVQRRTLWRALLWLWALAILYTTLSTAQHVVIDMLAGSALAVATWIGFNMWERRQKPATHPE